MARVGKKSERSDLCRTMDGAGAGAELQISMGNAANLTNLSTKFRDRFFFIGKFALPSAGDAVFALPCERDRR